MELQIRGVDGVNPTVADVVPDSQEVTGVLLNVVGITTDPGATATHLSVFPNALPAGQDPTTSNLNLAADVIKANLVFVPVGTDGKVRIFNNQGQTQVVADVVGYMRGNQAESTRAGRVVPLSSPYRTFDTRLPQFGGVALGPGQAEDWSFADFAASVAIGADAVGSAAGRHRQPHLGRAHPAVPDGDRPIVPHGLSDRARAGHCRRTSTPSKDHRSPTWPCSSTRSSSDPTVRVYNLAGYDHYLFDASAVVLANDVDCRYPTG